MSQHEKDLLLQLHQSQEDYERLLLIQQEWQQRCQQLDKEKQQLSFSVQQRDQQLQLQQQHHRLLVGWCQQLLHAAEPLVTLPAGIPEGLEADYRLLAVSGLFDASAYLTAYPDIAKAGIDPLLHYLQFGGAEGRLAGPGFDSPGYLARYPDIAETAINPLLHYLRYGLAEGRTDRT